MRLGQKGFKLRRDSVESDIDLAIASTTPKDRTADVGDADLFRVEVLRAVARNVFGEAVELKAAFDGPEDDIFEGADCVFAKLARVGVVTVRHRMGRWRREERGPAGDWRWIILDPSVLLVRPPQVAREARHERSKSERMYS